MLPVSRIRLMEKQGAGSRDKVKHIERNNQLIHNEDDVCGRATVTRDEQQVLD